MVRSILSAVALALSCTIANPNALHLNPTQAAASSMETFGGTTIPVGYYEYCQRYSERCARPADGSSVSLTQERWKEIIRINNEVNAAVEPPTDREIFGVEERW